MTSPGIEVLHGVLVFAVVLVSLSLAAYSQGAGLAFGRGGRGG